MSERENLQQEIAAWILDQKKFNAPYGVLTGQKKYAKGKARTIEFGIARLLDAEMVIVSPKLILVNGRGPAVTQYAGKYNSFEEIKKKFV